MYARAQIPVQHGLHMALRPHEYLFGCNSTAKLKDFVWVTSPCVGADTVPARTAVRRFIWPYKCRGGRRAGYDGARPVLADKGGYWRSKKVNGKWGGFTEMSHGLGRFCRASTESRGGST